ncbi:hypothetical protein DESUT3_31690 [Desulfuromonas versatilis]|uniref:Uncharacterized protein n=1 Tax=Desulfuromonas versatilis TaxID=2802975 RepID=A0ABM8HZQ0_9BACT|nr:hypothetical protein [Desulfuromonas versatilis]BCR06100.1 hypothetical protein DESUT3_31690 [Desulfuromonas versatilis]
MKQCRICQADFDPQAPLEDPAQQAGAILAEQQYGDAGQLCPDCLASRGRLAMMYCREYYGG